MDISEVISGTNKYLKSIIHNENSLYGLHSGMPGILLYNRYYNFYSSGNEFINRDELDLLILKCTDNSLATLDFSNGLAGKLWVFFNLYTNGLIELDQDELTMYNSLLLERLILHAKDEEWDNFRFAFGILFFLLDSKTIKEDELNVFLKLFADKMYKGSDFVFYKTYATINAVEKSYNLSLSHGISGNIIILTKALKQFPKNNLLKEILNDMIDFLLKYKMSKPNDCYFPEIVMDNYNSFNYMTKRPAWCYGDIGSGLALLRHSEATNNVKERQIALEVLMHSANCRGMKECGVFDAPLCHGSAGIMHVFNRLYFETKIKEFEKASDYWLGITLKHYETRGIEGFGALHPKDEKGSELLPYLLEGVCGISLALLSKQYPSIEPNWDGCLFLS